MDCMSRAPLQAPNTQKTLYSLHNLQTQPQRNLISSADRACHQPGVCVNLLTSQVGDMLLWESVPKFREVRKTAGPNLQALEGLHHM